MKKKKYPLTILISVKEKYISIIVNDIIHLEAQGNNTLIYMRNKKQHLDSKRLGKFLEQLDPNIFFRTHDSFAVNAVEVIEFEKGRRGTILMSNGLNAKFSENEKVDFMKRMKKG